MFRAAKLWSLKRVKMTDDGKWSIVKLPGNLKDGDGNPFCDPRIYGPAHPETHVRGPELRRPTQAERAEREARGRGREARTR